MSYLKQRRFINDCNAALAEVGKQRGFQSVALSSGLVGSPGALVLWVNGRILREVTWPAQYLDDELWSEIGARAIDDGGETHAVKFTADEIATLAEVRVGTRHAECDALLLARSVVDPDGKGLVDHWQKTSHTLITALILHLCYEMRREGGRDAHFGDVACYFSRDAKSLQDALVTMRDYPHQPDGPDPIVKEIAQEMINKDIRELTAVVSSAVSYLSRYAGQ